MQYGVIISRTDQIVSKAILIWVGGREEETVQVTESIFSVEKMLPLTMKNISKVWTGNVEASFLFQKFEVNLHYE